MSLISRWRTPSKRSISNLLLSMKSRKISKCIWKSKTCKTEVDEAYEVRKNSRKPRQEAMKRLAVMRKQDVGDTASTAFSISCRESAVLPKLDLPTFSGAVLEWPLFWEQFQAVVDSSHMTEITKFSYLLSLLRGEAKATAKGLSLTGAAYNTACEILCQKYGCQE